MRDLNIAYGNSCHAKTWSNKTTTFDALCDRLSTTIRTTESVQEYPKLPKAQRDQVKDKGGFVAGRLKDNRRRRENVASRSMLAFDADRASVDFVASFKTQCSYAACLYTTHGHTPENPRVRILVPLTRDVSSDEYVAIARHLAAKWGIDQFDECSYRPHQLMYWPTTPSNGEYVFDRIDGPWLDPDMFLASHPDWKDCSLLPTSPRESTVRPPSDKMQEDPLAKEGLVGAFCRAYSPIQDVIDTYLSHIYEPTATAERYSYIPADSTSGLAIYEGKFAQSYHASDPACGRRLNAFDLVRIHHFGDDDPKKSFNMMADLASKDDRVKALILEERRAEANADFAQGKAWDKQLKCMPRSKELENSVWNLNLILDNDPDLAGFAFNDLAGRIQVTSKMPWDRPVGNNFWRDADTAQLKSLIDIRYQCFSSRNYDVSFTKVADDRHFHPIRDYLNGLPQWDGIPRVEELFIQYLKADDTPYVREITRKTFAAAVARIYHPGTKFDNVLVLDGEQGIGKSTIVKDLVGSEYYSETLSLADMESKAGAEKLQGVWIAEIGELAGIKKADIEKVKAFFSTSDDQYRPSYGKVVESHPRQCVIIATVNGEHGYLRDITGNRRYWIIKSNLDRHKMAWQYSEAYRTQFWAEAKAIWENGEKLYLEGDFLEEAEKIQLGAMEGDEREGLVRVFLDTLLPENWDAMDLYERRAYFTERNSGMTVKGTVRRTLVCNMEIWCECYGKDPAMISKNDSYGITALMQKIEGWGKYQETKTGTRYFPIYGKQRAYVVQATEQQQVCSKLVPELVPSDFDAIPF
jgi:predicted P-loop ATPase